MGTPTRSVSPGTGQPPPLAADTFDRTVVNGFGAAETGGAWTVTGSTSQYSVWDGTGRVRSALPGAGPDVSLPAARARAPI